jgi:hypothetical protein
LTERFSAHLHARQTGGPFAGAESLAKAKLWRIALMKPHSANGPHFQSGPVSIDIFAIIFDILSIISARKSDVNVYNSEVYTISILNRGVEFSFRAALGCLSSVTPTTISETAAFFQTHDRRSL